VLANLSKTSVGYVYVDGSAFAQAIGPIMQESLKNMPASQAQQIGSQLKNLQAVQGMGISLSMMDAGMQLDSAVNFDVSKLDARVTAQLEAAKTPVDTAHLRSPPWAQATTRRSPKMPASKPSATS
jgi:hypothetical protein